MSVSRYHARIRDPTKRWHAVEARLDKLERLLECHRPGTAKVDVVVPVKALTVEERASAVEPHCVLITARRRTITRGLVGFKTLIMAFDSRAELLDFIESVRALVAAAAAAGDDGSESAASSALGSADDASHSQSTPRSSSDAASPTKARTSAFTGLLASASARRLRGGGASDEDASSDDDDDERDDNVDGARRRATATRERDNRTPTRHARRGRGGGGGDDDDDDDNADDGSGGGENGDDDGHGRSSKRRGHNKNEDDEDEDEYESADDGTSRRSNGGGSSGGGGARRGGKRGAKAQAPAASSPSSSSSSPPALHELTRLEYTTAHALAECVAEELSDNMTDEVSSENSSVLMGVVRQVRPGMDLSRVLLPTFILEPRSFLEKVSDYFLHMDALLDGLAEASPAARFEGVLRWYLMGFYIRPRGVKKPCQPVAGEVFRARLDTERHGSCFYVAEHMSHTPPMSAVHLFNARTGVRATGCVRMGSKFMGTYARSLIAGYMRVTLPAGDGHGEESYVCSWPDIDARGIIIGPMSMEYVGEAKLVCEATGYEADFEFKGKRWLGGDLNALSGNVRHRGAVLSTLDGKWTTRTYATDAHTGRRRLLVDPLGHKRAAVLKPMPASFDELESDRVWAELYEALRADDHATGMREYSDLVGAMRVRLADYAAQYGKDVPFYVHGCRLFEPVPGGSFDIDDGCPDMFRFRFADELAAAARKLDADAQSSEARSPRGSSSSGASRLKKKASAVVRRRRNADGSLVTSSGGAGGTAVSPSSPGAASAPAASVDAALLTSIRDDLVAMRRQLTKLDADVTSMRASSWSLRRSLLVVLAVSLLARALFWLDPAIAERLLALVGAAHSASSTAGGGSSSAPSSASSSSSSSSAASEL